jgi:uncharacterized protein YeaO (DUF488 family)
MSGSPSPGFRIKRIYDDPEAADGYRVLVDRLWPRGVSRDRAAIDLRASDLAPSNELRRWYGHDPAKSAAFRERYEHELAALGGSDLAEDLRRRAKDGPVTLLTATRDLDSSHLPVLVDFLSARAAGDSAPSAGGGSA